MGHRPRSRPDPARTRLPAAEQERAAAIASQLSIWYPRAGRWFPWRAWTDQYRLAIVEVLLQRTRADAVAAFIAPFVEEYPDWQRLSEASIGRLETALRPLGLQTRRAASLIALGRAVMDNGIDPESRDAPGVGQYISRAIAVGARNDAVPMIDSNWVRILRRVFGGSWRSDYRYDARLQSLAFTVVEAGDPRTLNWAVLDLGATTCTPRAPKCPACPLSSICEHGRSLQVVGSRLREE